MYGFDVPVHVAALREGTGTNRTRIRFLAAMNSLVFGECREVSETVIAKMALKRLFAGVDSLMSVQAGSLHESFLTRIATVSSTVFAHMTAKMSSVPDTIVKLFIAFATFYRQAFFIADC